MKIKILECDKTFLVEIRAENMSEAAILTRMGMNSKKVPIFCRAGVTKAGEFLFDLWLRKHHNSGTDVPRRN